VVNKYLPEDRRRELEHLAIIRRDQGHPVEQIAEEIAALGGITRLWAWRLAKDWTRSKLLERLRRTGDASVDESMLWRWETGEREPSREHLDRLCSVYQTRPDLLGYGHDYTQPNGDHAPTGSRVIDTTDCEPLAMVKSLTTSAVSTETVAVLERATARLQAEASTSPALRVELIRQYRAVREAVEGRQRVAERRRLAVMAARLGSRLGLLLWESDQPTALAYFEAAAVAAEEADDPALGAWVAERRASHKLQPTPSSGS
jgi:transcriptional regulator with XRE-family HTH domain